MARSPSARANRARPARRQRAPRARRARASPRRVLPRRIAFAASLSAAANAGSSRSASMRSSSSESAAAAGCVRRQLDDASRSDRRAPDSPSRSPCSGRRVLAEPLSLPVSRTLLMSTTTARRLPAQIQALGLPRLLNRGERATHVRQRARRLADLELACSRPTSRCTPRAAACSPRRPATLAALEVERGTARAFVAESARASSSSIVLAFCGGSSSVCSSPLGSPPSRVKTISPTLRRRRF